MTAFFNPLTEYSPQMEVESARLKEFDGESEDRTFDDHQEMELAIRLLEVADEEQLDHVLGNLIQRASREIGNPVRPQVGRAICGLLKTVARQTLPLAGRAIGERVGSSIGAQLGRGLASIAGQALGLELEGLSGEDREFEAVRQFVRFAGKTVKIAEGLAPNGDPADAAHRAAVLAAQVYAPGLTIGGRDVWRRSG